MERINAKDFLQQAFEIEKIIRAKQNHALTLRESAEQTTSTTNAERVSGTGARSKIESNILRAMEIEDCIKDLKGKQSEAKLHILNLIDMIDNPIYKEVLESRHIDFMCWDKIKENTNYSRRHIMRIYSEALKEIQKLLDNTSNVNLIMAHDVT